ncbi:Predicted thiol-disulfide oxidoreductase YuxK, DCC family [Lishizhenia tianjinensis]|uniref:Predicted thiol-disulfide oxidoreductase YuxK, DCC family n=1 Tax=Lishizhenia tianjinensis TaxID=477690 RepID=A0A1I6Y724_9FLAO|nr:DUF393 domain-containing protein [Lishizhenia tianjinensis]SFT46349.1 Predicted thiol-disulfide oxidoreductase YuxK, DCC family [Lishizhenia tianjinensis]
MEITKVYYDGDCGFCNASVAFILKNRKHDAYRFIPLQSKKAKEELIPFGIDLTDLSTIYTLKSGKLRKKSSAVLRLATDLKFPVNICSVVLIVPKPIRDFVYNWIAKHRLKLSRQKCYVPNPEEKSMFEY